MSRILALVGDYYHCSDQQIMLMRSVGVDESSEEHEVTTIRYPDLPASDVMGDYDLVIFGMMGRYAPRDSDETWFTLGAQERLAARVNDGGGLLVFHAGTASHRIDGAFREIVGGHFLHHPPEHPTVTISPIADHPVTDGVTEFAHPDEHYFVEVDDDVTPLLRATSELGETVAGWTAERGSGRVAVIVPGHTREMIGDPMLARLVRNAAAWCLGEA
jgi:hypothetical protein